MARLRKSALLEVPVPLAYGVVVDVERYPEFLPGCDAVAVLARTADGLEAQVTVSGMGLTQTFVTRNQHEPDSVTMSLKEGPFKSLHGVWRFIAIGDLGCRVEVDLQFELQGMLDKLFGSMAEKVANKLVLAFTQRMQAVADGQTG